MAEATIDLPQRLLDYANEQIAAGDYADLSDFLRDVLRREQTRAQLLAETQSGAEGERPLDQALESGLRIFRTLQLGKDPRR